MEPLFKKPTTNKQMKKQTKTPKDWVWGASEHEGVPESGAPGEGREALCVSCIWLFICILCNNLYNKQVNVFPSFL